ncbi:hypothetical protein F5B21DRAFT_272976 [Xylaria acuta]|nr:hypothetical protein F5B21DRAFT_272976 [Xylaria acuta]
MSVAKAPLLPHVAYLQYVLYALSSGTWVGCGQPVGAPEEGTLTIPPSCTHLTRLSTTYAINQTRRCTLPRQSRQSRQSRPLRTNPRRLGKHHPSRNWLLPALPSHMTLTVSRVPITENGKQTNNTQCESESPKTPTTAPARQRR